MAISKPSGHRFAAAQLEGRAENVEILCLVVDLRIAQAGHTGHSSRLILTKECHIARLGG